MAENQRQGDYFHISDVLSVVTGKMVSVNGMEGIYNILHHMTGESLFRHQLPRAMDVCRPYIVAEYPKFAHAATKNLEINEKNWEAWLNDQKVFHGGALFFIKPLPAGAYKPQNPIAEAVNMRKGSGNHANG